MTSGSGYRSLLPTLKCDQCATNLPPQMPIRCHIVHGHGQCCFQMYFSVVSQRISWLAPKVFQLVFLWHLCSTESQEWELSRVTQTINARTPLRGGKSPAFALAIIVLINIIPTICFHLFVFEEKNKWQVIFKIRFHLPRVWQETETEQFPLTVSRCRSLTNEPWHCVIIFILIFHHARQIYFPFGKYM